MKTFKTLYPTQPANRRPVFAVSSTATGCAILLLAAASTAHAQAADQAAAAPAAEPEEIVVTGIRKGIEDSISAKKKSSSIIEAVSAEDIGKLPDSSIAESIARLPGIAAQRTAGRAQTLSIRGLGPDYTLTTFNGREQATTNDNRTVEFDQYPSELVSQVKIYKTPDAAMSYQGIAGTADIETVHPLAYGLPARAVTYRREQDNQKGNVPGQPTGGDRFSLTYIDQFLDHTLGVAFGVAYNKSPYQAQTREVWGFPDVPGGQPGQKIIGGDKDGFQSSYFQRTGFLGVLEYKPTDALHMTVDAYHSNFHELQTIRRMEFGTVWAGATLSTQGPIVDGRMVSGTFTNVPFLVIENYANDRHARVDSIGWNTDYKVTDNWTLTGDLSYSKVKRSDVILESTAGSGAGKDPTFLPAKETASFTTNGDGVNFPSTTLDYSNYNTTFLTDPGGWSGSPRRSGYLKAPSTNDEIKAIRLAATRKLDTKVVNAVSVGVNYAERTKSKLWFQSALYLPAGVSHAVVPDAYRKSVINTSFFGNPYGMINYDSLGLLRSGFWTLIDARVDTNGGSSDDDRKKDYTFSWGVKEKLTTAYVKFDIDTQIGSVPLTGNIGVQTQTADQKSDLNRVSGIDGVNNTVIVTPVNLGATYTDVLPSMNLNFTLPHDVQLRFAAAGTVARPRMDDMAGGASLSVTQDSAAPKTLPNGQPYYWQQTGGGNPKLKPWKATAFDLSVEKYFSNKGYLSAAVYYKNLTSYIFNQSTIVNYAGVALPSPQANYTFADANRVGVATVKANGRGGNVKGLEMTVSLPGETFAPVLDGFGVIVSAAWNRSAINPTGQKVEALPGLSPRVINSTLYYEKYGFSARVSNRYRSDELGEVPEFDSSLTKRIVKSESLIDAQIGYEFREGPAKGLSLNLSGTNLTDAPFVLYDEGTPAFNVIKYEKYGAVYAGTVTYKF